MKTLRTISISTIIALFAFACELQEINPEEQYEGREVPWLYETTSESQGS